MMTNFEKIKNMNMECFSLWLIGIGAKCDCCYKNKRKCSENNCLENVREWLKSKN